MIVEYDVESFVYVLLWLAHRYGLENGKVKLINPEAYSAWRNDDRLHSIQAHQIALEEARDYVDKLPQSIRAPLRLAHGDYLKIIGELSTTLFQHKYSRIIDRMNGTSSKVTLSDLTHTEEVHKKFIDVIKSNESLKNTLERELDFPKTLWDNLAARGKTGDLWQQAFGGEQQMESE